MSTSLKINLKHCKFYGYHGFYPEEQVLGNTFWVDLQTAYHPQTALEDELAHTLNYEILYQIIKEEMNVPQKLLETVAFRILERIQDLSENIKNIKLSIQKENPPFGQSQANAEVKIIWEAE